MIKKYYVGIIAFLFVLIVLNSLCFGQASQSGTKRVMIKGKWVDTPVFTIKGGAPSYYDAHPEERAKDAATQANKPLLDMYQKLIEDNRTREQGYGRGMDRYYPIPFSPSPPSISPPSIPSGAINVRTGEYYPPVAGGVINPKTGTFYLDAAGGYINTKTGEFMPKIGGR